VLLRRATLKLSAASSQVDCAKFNDGYFAKDDDGEKPEFGEEKVKKPLDASKIADQKAVDAVLLPVIAKTENLKSYLSARFSLKSGMAPHSMKF
jgi:large subunit ribosomal protein L6e